MAEKHKHYWHHPHTIIEGRKPSEIAVVRYCACGERQVAFASDWQPAFGDYLIDGHYGGEWDRKHGKFFAAVGNESSRDDRAEGTSG